ncbi:MAG: hypothetical protein WAN48_10940 [Actinomycetes bacterium]
MTTFAPVLFLALAGFLVGGAWALRQQGRPLGVQVGLAVAGLLCLVVGGLYL